MAENDVDAAVIVSVHEGLSGVREARRRSVSIRSLSTTPTFRSDRPHQTDPARPRALASTS